MGKVQISKKQQSPNSSVKSLNLGELYDIYFNYFCSFITYYTQNIQCPPYTAV